MRVLKTTVGRAAGLAFAPDGAALLVHGPGSVQVWPDWLRAKPRRTVRTGTTVERVAFAPNGRAAYLYLAHESRTRALDTGTLALSNDPLRRSGPVWFHFDAAGGFALVHHDNAQLSRYDHAPRGRAKFRKAWTINRRATDPASTYIVSYYRFGAVVGGRAFVAVEVHIGGPRTHRALVVRATDDGAERFREPLDDDEANALVACHGPRMAVHPSGRYLAHADGPRVAFRALAAGTAAPAPFELPGADDCTAVAFDPAGRHLLAADAGGAVTAFDTATGRAARTLAWDLGPLAALAVTPDGTRAAAVAERNVVVWDADL